MTYSCFEVEERDRVAHVRLSRPDELNSMIPAFWRELPDIVGAISDRGSARAIVVSSTGRHFTAGMDLSVFQGGAGLPTGHEPAEVGRERANLRLNILRLQEAFTALERARVPVLAAVQGGCVGGGVDLACAADLRYATTDAFFCVQEVNIGVTADLGTLQRLPKLIPEGIAREYAYTGRRMSAQRAYELGFVNGLFDSQPALLEGVHAVALEIAANSPLAVWGSKDMLNHARDHTVRDGLDHIATWQTGMFQSADMTEAFIAKAERRAPNYDDLLPVRPVLE